MNFKEYFEEKQDNKYPYAILIVDVDINGDPEKSIWVNFQKYYYVYKYYLQNGRWKRANSKLTVTYSELVQMKPHRIIKELHTKFDFEKEIFADQL